MSRFTVHDEFEAQVQVWIYRKQMRNFQSDCPSLIFSIFTHCAMRSASVFLALITDTGSASLEPLQKKKKKSNILVLWV